MSEEFKIGEIAIYQNCNIPTNEGRECEIIECLAIREIFDTDGSSMGYFLCYRTRTSDGTKRLTRPHQLRKKQPPRSAKSIMREAILKAQQPAKVPA